MSQSKELYLRYTTVIATKIVLFKKEKESKKMEVGQRARESPRLKNPVSKVLVLLGHLPDHTFSDVWRADGSISLVASLSTLYPL